MQRVGRLVDRNDARSAPRVFYGFPGAICISLNDEAVHGIPGSRRIEPGDLVKLDQCTTSTRSWSPGIDPCCSRPHDGAEPAQED